MKIYSDASIKIDILEEVLGSFDCGIFGPNSPKIPLDTRNESS